MGPMNIINIYENYNSYFSAVSNVNLKAIFEQCSKIASKNGYRIYLIGGIVRDLLLNRECHDIDITIEGDAIAFVKILEKEINAKILSIHPDFGTIKAKINDVEIDFASTRNETYPKKGHLPHIGKIGCSLEEDVKRRDFTINSLAISLNKEDFANLIDYVGGFEDLKNKKIRILHDNSFIDDPTRIIRALKYSTRLKFEIEEHTFKLQEEYLQNINKDMCYKRVKQEVQKTFNQDTKGSLDKFIKQEIYKLAIQKPFTKTICDVKTLIKKHAPKNPWIVYFGVLAIEEDEIKFELSKTEREIIEDAKKLLNKTFSNDYEIYKAFAGGTHIETLLILAALGREKEVCHYINDLASIKPSINGNDLIKFGFQPSKKFQEAFDYILKEKLKKPDMNQAEEFELAKNFLNNN